MVERKETNGVVEIRNQSQFVDALIKNNITDVAGLIKELFNPEKSNENRKEYIDSLVHAQESDDDTTQFFEIVIDAVKDSLIDYLRIVSTALDNKGKGTPFYQEMQTVIGQS